MEDFFDDFDIKMSETLKRIERQRINERKDYSSIPSELLVEGIDFDESTLKVRYNPSHENYVNTSVDSNPTCKKMQVKIDSDTNILVNVYSIFQRNTISKYDGDGNPLVYAMKGEMGWAFATEKDRLNVERQVDLIMNKFGKMYQGDVTVCAPSTNGLNLYIMDKLRRAIPNITLYDGFFTKMSTEEIWDNILLPDSHFRKCFKKDGELKWAFGLMKMYLKDMNMKKGGIYVRHMVTNARIRKAVTVTLKLNNNYISEYADAMDGKNILIVDDTFTHGSTIREMVRCMCTTFSIKSVSTLTLFSPLKKK